MTKAFSINDGKGFDSQNYDFEQGSPDPRGRNIRAGKQGSNTAETALINPSGDFVDYSDGQVQGHRTAETAEQVLELLNFAAKQEI